MNFSFYSPFLVQYNIKNKIRIETGPHLMKTELKYEQLPEGPNQYEQPYYNEVKEMDFAW